MLAELFLKGLITGLIIAAPFGPIGILCIQRALSNGFKIGVMTGLGAALADGTYGIIAGYGLTAISSLVVKEQFWIRIVGGIILLCLGIKLLIRTPVQELSDNYEHSSWHALGTSYFLTLSNPATFIVLLAIFAGLGLGAMTNLSQIAFVVIGLIIGSISWSLILSTIIVFVLHRRLSPQVLNIINKIFGIIIILFALLCFLSQLSYT
ncbi:MAG: LysE family transporter [Legionella sp.]|jgi:threonine/homoserine/homoserine lactone efflux protein